MTFVDIELLLKLEAYAEYNAFTEEQKKSLCNVAEKIGQLPESKNPVTVVNNVKKYKKYEGEYIKKFEALGGNTDKLNEKFREYEKATIPLMKELIIMGKKIGLIK